MIRARLLLIAAIASSGCRTTMTSPTAEADTNRLLREFSSLVIPGGGASREFTLTTAGTIAVTLTSTTPAGTVVGVGIGIPRSNGSCALSAAVETTAGPVAQIAIDADTGPYCAKVYDSGTLTAPVPFTISISRP